MATAGLNCQEIYRKRAMFFGRRLSWVLPPSPAAGTGKLFPRHRGKKKQRWARKLFLFVRKSLIRKLLGSFRKSQICKFVMIGVLVRKSEIGNRVCGRSANLKKNLSPKMCGISDLRFAELSCELFTFEKM
jgi:hypothetical protein